MKRKACGTDVGRKKRKVSRTDVGRKKRKVCRTDVGRKKRKAKPRGSRVSSATMPSTSLPNEDLFPFPPEMLEEIFLNLPPNQVFRACRFVSHQWKDVADSESLWREMCRRERYHLHDGSRTPEDWRMFYFMCKKRRNLLKNPRAERKMKRWKTSESGGDHWHVEGIREPHPNDVVQKNFVTSYGLCRKMQLINLKKEGYNSSFMDNFQPDIKISDWYAPRSDCASEYEIRVELLDSSKNPVKVFADTVRFEQGSSQQWNEMTHVFRDYGPGVRYIRFTHGGQDRQFWAGWYGIRVTDSCVEICPAVDT